jgi:putative NIF3 family GTP cyclohydrolase 1 type 2
LIPAAAAEYGSSSGLGRVGIYRQPLNRDNFIAQLFDVLQLTSFNVAGTLPATIKKVAICGGSGSEFAAAAYTVGADVYLSAEIKHATAVWANEVDFAVIDGGHYATEKPVTRYLQQKLTEIVRENEWQIKIHLTETEKPPFVAVYKI